jgi:uncharacterized membrane protein YphA (DoxX/SURF4 family)
MNTALWVAQGLLAAGFLLAGGNKLFRSKDQLVKQMKWAEGFEVNRIKLIAGLEVVGAAGLVLPVSTGVLPWLTPLAAIALGVIMVGAVVTHLRIKEYPQAAAPAILLLLCGFVAYGRFELFG